MRSSTSAGSGWVISPNHNEILVDQPSEPARPGFDEITGLLTDWRIAANHNEILVTGDPSETR